jgi:hypothetical protein
MEDSKMVNDIADSGSNDARAEDSPGADARRWDDARIADEGINENGGRPISSEEKAIQLRAYSLWEAEGRPEGSHDDHWHRAKRELTDKQQLPAGDSSQAGP